MIYLTTQKSKLKNGDNKRRHQKKVFGFFCCYVEQCPQNLVLSQELEGNAL